MNSVVKIGLGIVAVATNIGGTRKEALAAGRTWLLDQEIALLHAAGETQRDLEDVAAVVGANVVVTALDVRTLAERLAAGTRRRLAPFAKRVRDALVQETKVEI